MFNRSASKESVVPRGSQAIDITISPRSPPKPAGVAALDQGSQAEGVEVLADKKGVEGDRGSGGEVCYYNINRYGVCGAKTFESYCDSETSSHSAGNDPETCEDLCP